MRPFQLSGKKVPTHPFQEKKKKSSMLGIQNTLYPPRNRNSFRRIRGMLIFLFSFFGGCVCVCLENRNAELFIS